MTCLSHMSSTLEFEHGLLPLNSDNEFFHRNLLLLYIGIYFWCLLFWHKFCLKTYLQNMGIRLEEWRVRRRDTEEWMTHRQLPPELQERVRRFVQYKWIATRGVDEESILHALPLDLRREIQRHLCLALVRRVSHFCMQLYFVLCKVSDQLSRNFFHCGGWQNNSCPNYSWTKEYLCT